MAAYIDYQFQVRILVQKINQTNDPVPLHQVEETTFPVNFFLYDTNAIPFHTREGIVSFPTAIILCRFISYQVAHIPVTDSLCRHARDFKEKLTIMGIPEIKQTDILREIVFEAGRMNSDNGVSNVAVEILKKIYLEVRVLNEEEDEVRRAQRESMEVEAKQIPATKSSIDALERLIFDAKGSARDCIVCMEEMEAGGEAIRMPCLHVYHSDCIIQWLQRSHLCPLCRYHMPCEL